MSDDTKAKLGEAMRELGLFTNAKLLDVLFNNAKLLNAADAHVRAVVEEMLQDALSPGTCWQRAGWASALRVVVQPVEKPAPARLDPSGTATGKTILTAPIVGRTTQHSGPASAHVDLETGVRTELGACPACTCTAIQAADPTRHFRECPLRAEHPRGPRDDGRKDLAEVIAKYEAERETFARAVTEAKAASLRWVLCLDIRTAPRAARVAICNEIDRLEATLKVTP